MTNPKLTPIEEHRYSEQIIIPEIGNGKVSRNGVKSRQKSGAFP